MVAPGTSLRGKVGVPGGQGHIRERMDGQYVSRSLFIRLRKAAWSLPLRLRARRVLDSPVSGRVRV